jgi:hypothetical protein
VAGPGQFGTDGLGSRRVEVDAGDAIAGARVALRQRPAQAAAGASDQYASCRHRGLRESLC